MQILANALPGFRDVRAPVIAGYLWLLFGWLLVNPDIERRPHSRLGRAIFDLASQVGHVGIALALSVVAYLLGSASQASFASLSLGSRRDDDEDLFRMYSGPLPLVVLRTFLRNIRLTLPIPRVENPAEHEIVGMANEFQGDFSTIRDLAEEQALNELDSLFSAFEHQVGAARREAINELSLPATLLVGDQPGLFAEVDRLRAEGELRVTVAPPLLALLILAIVIQGPSWALGVALVLVLLVDGLRKGASARQIIADAIRKGTIKSAAALRFVDQLGKYRGELDAVQSRHAVPSPHN